MNITFNLNYLLVLLLVMCIIILIYMLKKHIFADENPPNNQTIRGLPTEKNLPSNIDFFNMTGKIIEKSNKIIDRKNNKVYQYIDLGDKILIMEESLYIPEEESIRKEELVLNSDLNTYLEMDKEIFMPEQITSLIEKTILNTEVSDIEDMKSIISNADDSYDENYDVIQKELFDMEVNGAETISNDTSPSFLVEEEE